MTIVNTVKRNNYQDSMKLMQISRELKSMSGVISASAIMATEANLAMLKEAGLIENIPELVTANDLIVAIKAQSDEVAKEAISELDSLIKPTGSTLSSNLEYKNFGLAFNSLIGANLTVISVPGEYAKLEVAKAIDSGLHTFLFSDNLTVEEEIELKQRARDKGLLVMGPGCGTALIDGIGIGFANFINKGPIGVIAASGTGLQEITCLINNFGSGITHGIGVGGRDLSEEVGGIMTLEAIRMLKNDDNTEALVIVSKPPSRRVADMVVSAVRDSGMPSVVCFLGSDLTTQDGHIYFTSNLEDAALSVVGLTTKTDMKQNLNLDKELWGRAKEMVESFDSKQKYIRGLYSGGTLCYEAQQILTPILGTIYSNAPLNKKHKLKDSRLSVRNSCIDLGEEEFTIGRPHPMIDAGLRVERLITESSKPEVAVILFDVVLGYVASSDPAGDLVLAIRDARSLARKRGKNIAFVSHVCGTENDPQCLREQEQKLKEEGVLVFPTNALAARIAGWIVKRGEVDKYE